MKQSVTLRNKAGKAELVTREDVDVVEAPAANSPTQARNCAVS